MRKAPALNIVVFASAIWFVGGSSIFAQEAESSPLFQLFDPAPAASGGLTWDTTQPLLSVFKIKSIRLDSQTGDYQLTFTDSDSEKLGKITDKRSGKLLIVVSDGEALVIFRLRAPIVDGVMRIQHAPGSESTIEAFVEKLKKRQQ